MIAISVFPRFKARPLLLGLALCVAGCAGTRVEHVATGAPAVLSTPPQTIAVFVEDASPIPEKESRRQTHADQVRETEADLTDGLSKLFASRQLRVVPPGSTADLVLRCRILELKGGSKALRLLVGFGAGKAVLRASLSLSEARQDGIPPLLAFETSGTSGRMPGGGGSLPGLVGAGVGALRKDGLPKEADQLTERVDEEIGKYFTSRNWPYPKPADD